MLKVADSSIWSIASPNSAGMSPGRHLHPHKHAVDEKRKLRDSVSVHRANNRSTLNSYNEMKLFIPSFPRRWLAVGFSFAAAVAVQAQTQVTFQIDMSSETAGTPSSVYISGSFNGWTYEAATNALVNAGGTIWTNTFLVTDPPGTVESCKFQDNLTGWEPLAANRQFVLGTGTQVLPLTEWNTSDWPTPTNQVTFQVDMSAQVLLGNFTNGNVNNTITVSGDFEGWDNGLPLTNNPTLSGDASNIYSGTFGVPGFPPAPVNYKFRMNGGWESPTSTSGGNRTASVTNNEVLPLVYYNDNSIYDLVTSPITVTFTLYMTNGTATDSGGTFTKGSDILYVSGDWLNWPSWGLLSLPQDQQMVEVGSSDYYTNSFVIPKGNSIYITYKYSVDGLDNENGTGTNHVRLIRTYGPTYTFPSDIWSWTVMQPGNGNPYPLAGLAVTNIVEPDFGYLAIGAQSGGQFPITWLGRPGVVLQNNASLSSGNWNTNTGTDGTMSTNWPNTGSDQFFRLLKKQ